MAGQDVRRRARGPGQSHNAASNQRDCCQGLRRAEHTDNKQCIVLDYPRTSTVAHWIRDEIRNVAPRLYLGFAYWGKTRFIGFSLDFTSSR